MSTKRQAESSKVSPYGVRSQNWALTFQSDRDAAAAAAALRKHNLELGFLRPGADPKVEGPKVTIQWSHMVKGKSMYDRLYSGDLRSFFGPRGKLNNFEFEAVFLDSSVPQNLTASAPSSTAAPLSAAQVDLQGFLPLPTAYQCCDFNSQTCWSNGPHEALDAYGFVVVRKFLPEYMTTPALSNMVDHFSKVLGSFTHGYALDDISKVLELPGKVWEKNSSRTPAAFSRYAHVQKWGVRTARGYQQELGLGKCMDAQYIRAYPSIMAAQHYIKPLIAHLHGVPPESLCWQPDDGSIKVANSPAAPAHRDLHDSGRYQCVVALSDGAFDAWPVSHKLAHGASEVAHGHFHASEEFQRMLCQHCRNIVFSAAAGDIFIFQGGSFVHGSPAIPSCHPLRVVTFGTFWPPGTERGDQHARGKCGCKRPF